jgi:hypothetical protein
MAARNRAWRIVAGAIVWIALLWATWSGMGSLVLSEGTTISGDLAPALWRYTTGKHVRIDAVVGVNEGHEQGHILAALGDPVFVIAADGSYRQVGEIAAVGDFAGPDAMQLQWVRRVGILFYPEAPPLTAGARLVHYETPWTTEWILRTILPPAQRQKVLDDLRETFRLHQAQVVEALRPIAEESLIESLATVQAALPAAIRKHEQKLQAISARYQIDIVEKQLLPLVKEEIFPVAREKALPVANKMGRKMWDRVSLWRFGVRFLWDRAPGTDGEAVKREWERFLKEEAAPIVEAHTDEMMEAVQQIIAAAAKNPKVQAAFKNVVAQVVRDDELQAVVGDILRETVVENAELREVLRRHWTSPRAKAALAMANEKVEPLIIRTGDMLFGTRETGVTTELARVLRYRLLHKDERWFSLILPAEPAGGPAPLELPIIVGGEPPLHPFVDDRRRLTGK